MSVSVLDAKLDALMQLKTHLEGQSDRIYQQIRAYPAPIAACDLQFNHLLEQRSDVTRELLLLEKLMEQCHSGVTDRRAAEEFLASCRHMNDDLASRLRSAFEIGASL